MTPNYNFFRDILIRKTWRGGGSPTVGDDCHLKGLDMGHDGENFHFIGEVLLIKTWKVCDPVKSGDDFCRQGWEEKNASSN